MTRRAAHHLARGRTCTIGAAVSAAISVHGNGDGVVLLGHDHGAADFGRQSVYETAEEKACAKRDSDDDVAVEQAARLLREAMDPFEPDALHPTGRALHIAAQEAETHTHAEPPGAGQKPAQAMDQVFLLG